MSKTTHYELNTPIGSEVLSVMTGLNPNFNTIDETMYDNEVRSTQALNKANVNEQNIATALGRLTTAEGDIDTLENGLETANTNISGLTSRMTTAENGLVTANNRIQENASDISNLNTLTSDMNTRINANTLVKVQEMTKNVEYTAPTDGYFKIGFTTGVTSGEYTYGYINEILMNEIEVPSGSPQVYHNRSIFVKKGMRLKFEGSAHAGASFYSV